MELLLHFQINHENTQNSFYVEGEMSAGFLKFINVFYLDLTGSK